MISCRVCREHLSGYVSRELPTALRTQVAAHIDSCDACYAQYAQMREVSSELARTLPTLGTPRMDKMWAAVESDLRHPRRETPRIDQVRYSVIVIVLLIAFLMPWTLRAQQSELPTPPTPAAGTPLGTPVAAVLVKVNDAVTPPLQSNYAPSMGATDSPRGY